MEPGLKIMAKYTLCAISIRAPLCKKYPRTLKKIGEGTLFEGQISFEGCGVGLCNVDRLKVRPIPFKNGHERFCMTRHVARVMSSPIGNFVQNSLFHINQKNLVFRSKHVRKMAECSEITKSWTVEVGFSDSPQKMQEEVLPIF